MNGRSFTSNTDREPLMHPSNRWINCENICQQNTCQQPIHRHTHTYTHTHIHTHTPNINKLDDPRATHRDSNNARREGCCAAGECPAAPCIDRLCLRQGHLPTISALSSAPSAGHFLSAPLPRGPGSSPMALPSLRNRSSPSLLNNHNNLPPPLSPTQTLSLCVFVHAHTHTHMYAHIEIRDRCCCVVPHTHRHRHTYTTTSHPTSLGRTAWQDCHLPLSGERLGRWHRGMPACRD